jgi:catechol 2,3-dioxygenase-like lactoylglutathione lyase family enzyme
MIDHVSINVRDLEASGAFYDAVLATIGLTRVVAKPETIGFGKTYPEFWLNARPGSAVAAADSGAHICLRARTIDAVDAFHTAAIGAGGSDDGPPGMRLEYNDRYYAAFIRDPDGNRIEVVTFLTEA